VKKSAQDKIQKQVEVIRKFEETEHKIAERFESLLKNQIQTDVNN